MMYKNKVNNELHERIIDNVLDDDLKRLCVIYADEEKHLHKMNSFEFYREHERSCEDGHIN
jgi:hypothetical protein